MPTGCRCDTLDNGSLSTRQGCQPDTVNPTTDFFPTAAAAQPQRRRVSAGGSGMRSSHAPNSFNRHVRNITPLLCHPLSRQASPWPPAAPRHVLLVVRLPSAKLAAAHRQDAPDAVASGAGQHREKRAWRGGDRLACSCRQAALLLTWHVRPRPRRAAARYFPSGRCARYSAFYVARLTFEPAQGGVPSALRALRPTHASSPAPAQPGECLDGGVRPRLEAPGVQAGWTARAAEVRRALRGVGRRRRRGVSAAPSRTPSGLAPLSPRMPPGPAARRAPQLLYAAWRARRRGARPGG